MYACGVAGLAGPPPPSIAIDASALLHALVEDETHHEAYRAYLERVVTGGSSIVYCELIELELASGCSRILKRLEGGTPSREAKRNLLEDVMRRWHGILAVTEHIPVPLSDEGNHSWPGLLPFSRQLMCNYPIDSYDAAHAAAAITLDVPLLTHDRHFCRIPDDLLLIVTERSERFSQYRTLLGKRASWWPPWRN